jgi:hypothetical protein
MGSRVEQFERIRRDRDREGLSIRGLAKRHGVHRRAVKQALASAVPSAKRSPTNRPAPKLGPYWALIDEWLLADRDAPPKQRHTAKRIWWRLVDEHGADVAEVTVRQHVRSRKRELGWPVGEVFVPQVHAPGVEAEVDWGEALVVLGGVSVKVHLFVMRASFSGAAFCQASLVETQQAFLELHVQAFEWFGGVFGEIRFEYVPGHIFIVLFPNGLCAHPPAVGRGHGGRAFSGIDRGHITVRATRASSGARCRTARLAWCGIPPKCPEVRWLAAPVAWLWC